MNAMLRIPAVAVAAVLAVSVAACSADSGAKNAQGPEAAKQQVGLIGDGSTAFTGPQPNQPKVTRLRDGRKPPQFVVFSWDGAGEDGQRLFSHFREVAKEHDASMTYFLSGIYVLPKSKRELYRPPRHRPGASDIGFLDDADIKETLAQVRGAWLEGSEIGTHFNGHFCGLPGGVGTWSPQEWKSEIEQAESFVKNWKTNTGWRDLQPLPFDYSRELVGGRAPCLEGQENLIPAAKEMGFRYDASSRGGTQVWPKKTGGIWDFPLQQIPVPGRSFETLAMDYNFLANQSGTVKGDHALHKKWEKQTRDGFLAGFARAYNGNRAPMFIGNHFEQWNGGAYMRAVEDVIERVCTKDEVRCVSFRQLADWLDAQNPRLLDRLRTLRVGERPDWKALLADDSEHSAKVPSAKKASEEASEKVERAQKRAEELAGVAERAEKRAERARNAAKKAAQDVKAAKKFARKAEAKVRALSEKRGQDRQNGPAGWSGPLGPGGENGKDAKDSRGAGDSGSKTGGRGDDAGGAVVTPGADAHNHPESDWDGRPESGAGDR